MKTRLKIWDLVEKNRWTVIVPVIGVILWVFTGIACVPKTPSPIRPTVELNAAELQLEYETWRAENEIIIKQFEWAVEDIKQKQEQLNTIEKALLTVATGGVSNVSGLIDIIITGSAAGLFADNIRKNGVIAGLKRGKKNK